MKAHLSKIHAINSESEASVSVNISEQTSMRFFLKKSVEEAIAKMACKDGFSFRQIASSEYIQSNLATNVYDIVLMLLFIMFFIFSLHNKNCFKLFYFIVSLYIVLNIKIIIIGEKKKKKKHSFLLCNLYIKQVTINRQNR